MDSFKNINKTFDASYEQFIEEGTKIPTSYFSICVEIIAAPIYISEASDEDLVALIEKTGAFEYLHSPVEDIYSLDDGTPI